MTKRFGVGILAGALIAAAFVHRVIAVDPPDRLTPIVYWTPFRTSFSNETATATNHIALEVPASSTAVLQVSLVAENAGTNAITFYFKGSLDRANWTTEYPWSVGQALNGTNPVTSILSFGTNLQARFISLDKVVTAQTNLVTISQTAVTFLPKP